MELGRVRSLLAHASNRATIPGRCLLLLVRSRSAHHARHGLRWPNTVFDTCVSFTFFSKTLDPLVAKNVERKLTTQTSVLCILFLKLKYNICIIYMGATLAELCLLGNKTHHSQVGCIGHGCGRLF